MVYEMPAGVEDLHRKAEVKRYSVFLACCDSIYWHMGGRDRGAGGKLGIFYGATKRHLSYVKTLSRSFKRCKLMLNEGLCKY